MAKLVEQITLGVDTCKDSLVVYHWEQAHCLSLANDRAEIRAWLGAFQGPVRVAIEPTSTYHLAVVEQAHALGHTVYLINARQIPHYRRAIEQRHKSDPHDAELLARYLAHEAAQLRPHQPQHPKAQRLWALLKRRAAVVEARKQLHQSLSSVKLCAKALFSQFDQLLKRIERLMFELVRALGWWPAYRHCRSIPGIGPTNAIALVSAFHRGAFANSDAFVAFLGLDVRLKDSGKFEGKRKLTKRGESELRRLLYCAAQPARCYAPFEAYLQRQHEKGLSKTAAKVALGRKLARIAFALIQGEKMFEKTPTGA